MASFEHVHNLMVEVGELMELPRVSEYAEERAWQLVTPAGAAMEADYDEAADRVLLTAPVGAPGPVGREALYEAMLLHNGRVSDPRVPRVGLEGPGGEVVLLLEHPGTGLDAPRLQALVEELTTAAGVWRERLWNPPVAGKGGDGGAGAFRPDMLRA